MLTIRKGKINTEVKDIVCDQNGNMLKLLSYEFSSSRDSSGNLNEACSKFHICDVPTTGKRL